MSRANRFHTCAFCRFEKRARFSGFRRISHMRVFIMVREAQSFGVSFTANTCSDFRIDRSRRRLDQDFLTVRRRAIGREVHLDFISRAHRLSGDAQRFFEELVRFDFIACHKGDIDPLVQLAKL